MDKDEAALKLAEPFINQESLVDVAVLGSGLESVVIKAVSSKHGVVALKVPRCRVYRNVNDPNTDAKDLLKQDLIIYETLHGGPVPVPRPFGLLEIDDYPATICEFVPDDASSASPAELGRVAALIHSCEPPQAENWSPVAHEGHDALTAIAVRLIRRFAEFVKAEPAASGLGPSQEELKPIIGRLRRFPSSLLHMDFRHVNLRHKEGRIMAITDWSNAMVGPAAIDLYRILELERPGNGFTAAYGALLSLPDLDKAEETLLRLDAALMLALVFISEAPDPTLRGPSVQRVIQLAQSLQRLSRGNP